MENFKDLSFNNSVGHYTLLYGETNTKKTYLTSKFVKFLVEQKGFHPEEISILDFAPPLSRINNLKIGGKIQDFYKASSKCNNILYRGEIIPSRLKANNKKEVYNNACDNFKKAFKTLIQYYRNPTPTLIINDISIYLHIGNKLPLLKAIEKSTTFFGNSYYGSSIKSDLAPLLSTREKRLVKYLVKKMDYSYFTG
ncbi:MAG: hypothetical protein ACXABO_21520 [Promethearchaeota archaeon]|jgi:hypothetical protein